MWKPAKRLILGGAALLSITAVAGYMGMDRYVRWLIVRETSEALGVPTSISIAAVSLGSHVVKLGGCSIDNPPGCSSPKLLILDGVVLNIPLGELDDHPVHVNSVTFSHPQLFLERVDGKWNTQIVSHSERPNPRPLRITIGKVAVNDAVVTLRPHVAGMCDELTVNIPTFELDNVQGTDGGAEGVTIGDALLQITGAMAEKALESSPICNEIAQSLSPEKLVGAVISRLDGPLKFLPMSPASNDGQEMHWGFLKPTTRR